MCGCCHPHTRIVSLLVADAQKVRRDDRGRVPEATPCAAPPSLARSRLDRRPTTGAGWDRRPATPSPPLLLACFASWEDVHQVFRGATGLDERHGEPGWWYCRAARMAMLVPRGVVQRGSRNPRFWVWVARALWSGQIPGCWELSACLPGPTDLVAVGILDRCIDSLPPSVTLARHRPAGRRLCVSHGNWSMRASSESRTRGPFTRSDTSI
jgi:hypothetical protein